MKKYSNEKKQQVLDMLRQGKVGIEIASLLNVSSSFVTHVRQANGFEKGKGGRTKGPEKKESVVKRHLTNTGDGKYGGAF